MLVRPTLCACACACVCVRVRVCQRSLTAVGGWVMMVQGSASEVAQGRGGHDGGSHEPGPASAMPASCDWY